MCIPLFPSQTLKDILVATGGRPGIGLWISADNGAQWTFYNIAAEHNRLIAPHDTPGVYIALLFLLVLASALWVWYVAQCTCFLYQSVSDALMMLHVTGRNGTTGLGYHPTLAAITSIASADVTPPQTTGYTGLSVVGEADPGDNTSYAVVVAYDRLANGWAGPSADGAWGVEDMVFTMRVHVNVEGIRP
jgi:hypothetical protein